MGDEVRAGIMSARAERDTALILMAVITANALVIGPAQLVAAWPALRLPILAILSVGAPVLGAAWMAYVVRHPGVAPRSTVDLALAVALLVIGSATELWGQPEDVSPTLANVGMSALTLTGFLGPRVPMPWSWVIPLLAAGEHLIALRDHSSVGLQGALMIIGVWIASSVMVSELRRAGRDADLLRDAARRAEREEASARVHDTQGLLRLASRPSVDRSLVATAAQAATRRNQSWLANGTASISLSSELARVVAAVPDLDVRLDVTDLPTDLDEPRIQAVARAVHTLLGNIREHAGTSSVTIGAHGDDDRWQLSVSDDGIGFDVASSRRGRGLTRYTAEALRPLGLTVRIASRPGHGTRVDIEGPRSVSCPPYTSSGPSRFAGWKHRMAAGEARASLIVDLARGGALGVLWLMILSGSGDLAGTDWPGMAIAASVLGAGALTAHWLAWRLPAVGVSTAVVGLAVGCGAAMSVAAGPAATSGTKLGTLLAAWAVMYLATIRPDHPWAILPLAWVQAAVLHRVDPVGGVLTSVFASVGILVAATMVRSCLAFGREADLARLRVVRAERRQVADLLARQVRALRLITAANGSATTDAFVDQVSDDVRLWLDGGSPGGLDTDTALGTVIAQVERLSNDRVSIDLTDLTADGDRPTPRNADLVAALTDLEVWLRANACRSVDVRGTRVADAWNLSVLMDDRERRGEQRGGWDLLSARSAHLGVVWQASSIAPGVTRLVARPRAEM